MNDEPRRVFLVKLRGAEAGERIDALRAEIRRADADMDRAARRTRVCVAVVAVFLAVALSCFLGVR